MEFAHQMRLNFELDIDQSVRLAWKAYRLSKLMKNESISFAYLKKDGSYRKAVGRLSSNEAKKQSPWRGGVFVYYDVHCGEYRSFRMDYLVSPNLLAQSIAA
jgi:hypothetical protein